MKTSLNEHLKIHTREHPHSGHFSESIGSKQSLSRCLIHSSTLADNKATNGGLASARSTLSEVNNPVLHTLETPYIFNVKQEEQD